MPTNGIPDAWIVQPDTPVAPMFQTSNSPSPIAKPSGTGITTVSKSAIARPTVIRTPTLPATIQQSGTISLNLTPDDLIGLVSALNRATGQGQSQAKFTQDPIAMGLVGFGLLCLTGIGGYSIATLSAQTPAAVHKAELDRIERISARESAATRKLAEKAAEQRSICVFSLGCPGGK